MKSCKRVIEVFGTRFLLFLIVSQTVCKGILSTILEAMSLPLFKSVAHVSAADAQIYAMVAMIPWSIKPLIGLCSDIIPLYGYNKRGWLLVSAVVGGSASLALLLYGILSPTLVGSILVVCYVGINFEIALYDLLSEGKYAELRKRNPDIGSLASTITQGMQVCGTIIALFFVGPLSDARAFVALFAIACGLCLLPIVPTLLGWLPEERIVNRPCVHVDTVKLRRDGRMIAVVAFCGLSGIITSLVTTLTVPIAGLVTSLVLLVCCLVGCRFTFSKEMSAVANYQVISTLSQPLMGTALDYFYTATPACLAEGPHFSYTYYVMTARIIGAVISFVGVWFYGLALSRMTFRRVLLLTTILISLAGLSDLFIVTRTNIRLGIPDKAAYLVGEAVLEPFLGMLNYIPISALISIAVTDGMEASCYAMIAGIANFARMVSELDGSVIFTAAGIVASETGPCDFTALPWLVLSCHILAPLCIGIPAVFLLPDIKQDQNFSEPTMEEGVGSIPMDFESDVEEEPSTVSLLQRLTRWRR